MPGEDLTALEVLHLVPHQPPFRFIDEIHELDAEHILASYRYRPDEFFFRGHFPGNPITPGVVLIETMAQAGVVALGLYLGARGESRNDLRGLTPLFTDTEVEFHHVVRPGQQVVVEAHKLFFRHNKLRVRATLCCADGTLACSGTLAGMGLGRK